MPSYCVFNNCWATIEVYGTEEYVVLDDTFCRSQCIVGFGIVMGFVDQKKNIGYYHIYPINICSMVKQWRRFVKLSDLTLGLSIV